uniref:Uncharacterized protein n=1 Tax=Ditylenchus dipsaci TaxID=166011 RepID=A0A915DIC3_9BILA
MHTSRSETIELLAGLSGVRFCETLPRRNSKFGGGRSTGCIPEGLMLCEQMDERVEVVPRRQNKQTAEIGVQCNIGYQEGRHTSKLNIHSASKATVTKQPHEQLNESTSSIASVLPPNTEEESTKRWLFDTSYIYLEDTKASGGDAANFLSASL